MWKKKKKIAKQSIEYFGSARDKMMYICSKYDDVDNNDEEDSEGIHVVEVLDAFQRVMNVIATVSKLGQRHGSVCIFRIKSSL